jgi:hypothetical protein
MSLHNKNMKADSIVCLYDMNKSLWIIVNQGRRKKRQKMGENMFLQCMNKLIVCTGSLCNWHYQSAGTVLSLTVINLEHVSQKLVRSSDGICMISILHNFLKQLKKFLPSDAL